jgi:hypothetical protein
MKFDINVKILVSTLKSYFFFLQLVMRTWLSSDELSSDVGMTLARTIYNRDI